MQRADDVQLIQRILSGDDDAFRALVRNHQKSIHALAWRKVGDFHIAEEITQDTFLQAYTKLAQLKNPSQFAGWIYVIANRLCLKRLREKKSVIRSLEDTPMDEVNKFSYTRYVSEQREAEAVEHRHELVKKLLAKLPESERTVVTLHYLGEMTTKEIGKFLGVSVNTIKSRLRRGIKRLKEQREDFLVRETLGSIQFPAHVTERIMRQVAEIKPTVSPPVGNPLLPWAALGTTVVLVLLMLGVSNQILARFQKPYSFETRSEPTVEIVDALIVLDIPAKPAVRNQFGQAAAPGKSSGAGTQVSDVTPVSVSSEDPSTFSTSQWTQGKGPPAGYIRDLFATSEGTVYAIASTGIYRLSTDETAWIHVNASIPIGESRMPMAAHDGTLYIVSTDEIFTSDDSGETWKTLGSRPKGDPVGLVITDVERASSPQVPITMYLALKDEGIFRSTDGGTQWSLLNDGLTVSEKISAVAAVGKTVFAGTENGLYRLDSGIWKKLPLDTPGAVCSLTVSGNDLYAGIGNELLVRLARTEWQGIQHGDLHFAKIFHSTDLGVSWREIRLGSKHLRKTSPAGITVLATGKTLLALSYAQSRSTDGGQTWTELENDQNFLGRSRLPAVMVNERTYYKANVWGIHRTTDGGASWHIFMNGMAGTVIIDLVAFNNRLYAHSGYEVYQSIDEGVSWKKVRVDGQEAALNPKTKMAYESKLVVVNNTLYFLSSEAEDFQIFRLSTDDDTLIPVHDVPLFDRKTNSSYAVSRLQIDAPYAITRLQGETATTSGDAFYVEYQRGLFKWKVGDPKWTYTGLADESQGPDHWNAGDYRGGFKTAVSGKTVYVGQRNGKLFQSLDEGDSWRDLTPSLPLRFNHFKEIVFIGSTVYVSTDEGALTSQTGEHWRVLTDNAGARPIINRFATDSIKVYGIGDAGIYCLDPGNQWKQISSEVMGDVISLAIINDRLYSAVNRRGIFHISLEEE